MVSLLKSCILGLLFATIVLSCPSKFKNSSDFMLTVASHCILKLKISENNVEKVLEMIKDPEQDDKCLSKCFMEKLDVVNANGIFDRDVIFDYLEDAAPKNLLTKLTEIVNKCADSSEIDKTKDDVAPQSPPLPPTKPVTPPAPSNYENKDECKAFHDYYSCFTINAEKLC